MAYLSGIKHRLFMREESTYGELLTGSVVSSATDQGWISGFNAYARPGAKLSVQNSPINQPGMGRPSAMGRSRSSVAGSFSFYLPKADRYANRGSAVQTQGFLLFLKHLYGDATTFGSNQNENTTTRSTGNLPHSGDPGSMGWQAEFSKFDTVKDHPASTVGLYNTASKKTSFSFISYYGTDEAYLYTGVCPTSMTISASDPNSLITADVSFIARSVTKLWFSSTTDTGTFYPYSEPFYDVDGTKIDTDVALMTAANSIFFTTTTPANNDGSLLMSESFSAINTTLEVGFTNGETFITSASSDFQATGISVNISRPLGHTNEFGGTANSNFMSRRFPTTSPRLTGNKSISGSFTMPVYKTTTHDDTDTADKSYIEQFRKASQGITNYEDISLDLVITEEIATGETDLGDIYTFSFDNINFSSTDFGSIDTGISTTTVNWQAVPSKNNLIRGDRFARVKYEMK